MVMFMKRIEMEVYEKRINEIGCGRFSVVSFDSKSVNAHSYVNLICHIDGNEWSSQITNIIHNKTGCMVCSRAESSKKRMIDMDVRVSQINSAGTGRFKFLRWIGGFNGAASKALCRCEIDGFEWSSAARDLISGKGCPQCGGVRRLKEDEQIARINESGRGLFSFSRWDGEFKNSKSKAVCICSLGHEWTARITSIVSNGSGCPKCCSKGYNPSLTGYLYALRSKCGEMVKIGISNNYEKRHIKLSRTTPFKWYCVGVIECKNGDTIQKLERLFLGALDRVDLKDNFDGYTEWRKWDDLVGDFFRSIKLLTGTD